MRILSLILAGMYQLTNAMGTPPVQAAFFSMFLDELEKENILEASIRAKGIGAYQDMSAGLIDFFQAEPRITSQYQTIFANLWRVSARHKQDALLQRLRTLQASRPEIGQHLQRSDHQ